MKDKMNDKNKNKKKTILLEILKMLQWKYSPQKIVEKKH
jgi:hypothetical protein